MWPFNWRRRLRRGRAELPRCVLDWPATIPEGALASDDRELIRRRWERALDQGFAVEPHMRAAFEPLPRLMKESRPTPMSNAAHERELGMSAAELDREWTIRKMAIYKADLDAADRRRLPSSVAVLAALGLTAQADQLRTYIEQSRAALPD